MELPGSRLTRIAPTVANESTTRAVEAATTGLFPPGGSVTRLIATKTTDTTHSAQTATACQRAGRARLIVLPNARWLELLNWAGSSSSGR